MQRAIVLFTDFGTSGPYVGQMKAVLLTHSPGVPVIDLLADAPAFSPRASAYLLAALLPDMPPGAVILAVVDPGVGGERQPVVIEADGRFLVGPDNGLLELAVRRAGHASAWRIDWRPQRLSASFHGRDLFAPIAARLACGETPQAAGCLPLPSLLGVDWPDDLPEVIYLDHYGNAMTGLRADSLPSDARLCVGEHEFAPAQTFSSVPPGQGFWYRNSIGLAEIAVNQGRAGLLAGVVVGAPVRMMPIGIMV